MIDRYFPAAYQTDMLCIAYYESSYCPDVYNGICCYGLWQINANHLGEPGCPGSASSLYEYATAWNLLLLLCANTF